MARNSHQLGRDHVALADTESGEAQGDAVHQAAQLAVGERGAQPGLAVVIDHSQMFRVLVGVQVEVFDDGAVAPMPRFGAGADPLLGEEGLDGHGEIPCNGDVSFLLSRHYKAWPGADNLPAPRA